MRKLQKNKQKKIAFFLPSLEGGGAERFFVDLANRFFRWGIEVDFVLVQAKGRFLVEVQSGIKVIDLNKNKTILSILRLKRYIEKNTPDIIVSGLDTANVVNLISCWLAGVKSRAVLTQRCILTETWYQNFPLSAGIWIFLFSIFYKKARLIIGNSYKAIFDLRRNLGINEKCLKILYNSVDINNISRLAAEPLEHPWALRASPPIILHVGSLTKNKDIRTCIKAFAKVRKNIICNLVVIGDGKERSSLETLVCRLGIQKSVLFTGFDRNPFRWMARARVLVSSSPSESCPNVILQALSCGLQVVATDGYGGTNEILEGGKWGLLTPVGDDQALALSIEKAIRFPLPEDGRKRAAFFNPNRTAKAYLNLLIPGWRSEKKEIH